MEPLQHFFSASRSSATTHPEFRCWVGLPRAAKAKEQNVEVTIKRLYPACKNDKYIFDCTKDMYFRGFNSWKNTGNAGTKVLAAGVPTLGKSSRVEHPHWLKRTAGTAFLAPSLRARSLCVARYAITRRMDHKRMPHAIPMAVSPVP